MPPRSRRSVAFGPSFRRAASTAAAAALGRAGSVGVRARAAFVRSLRALALEPQALARRQLALRTVRGRELAGGETFHRLPARLVTARRRFVSRSLAPGLAMRLTLTRLLARLLASRLVPPRLARALAFAIRTRLAPLERVPVLAKSMAQLRDDMKEPKTAFVIGFVDGVLPLETILEVTGLPELDTLQILERLIAQGAIVFPRRH